MKNLLSYFFFLLFGFINAQIVNIPDANFKTKLLGASPTSNIAQDAAGNNIIIDINNDGEIQVGEAELVYRLMVTGIEDFPDFHINNLTGIESFTNLTSLFCATNNLANLEVSSLINLEVLVCAKNELTELDITNLINLQYLVCDENNLTSLDVSNSENLIYLTLGYNSITVLDCSNNPNLEFLDIRDNQITYLNLKNGTSLDEELYTMSETADAFGGFSNFANICVDESEINFIETFLSDLFEWDLNTYCTFSPVEDHNTITGSINFDLDNNGCDENDSPQQFIKINIDDGVEEYSSFTDNGGNYIFYIQDGTYTLTPQVENSEYFNLNPETEIVNFPIVDNSTEIRDFCITADGIHPDVEIVIAPVAPARPGFSATYKVVYRNTGNQTVSGNIEFDFDENLSEFLSSNPNPDVQNFGILTYNFTDLLPFENREILIELAVNTPTDTPPVNIGDVLIFTSEITIPADENPEDNNYTFNQIVVGSYDPNDIICLEGENVSPDVIGEELHYFIRFENTGNHQAERVVISMEIDPDLYDISTLQLLNSSHEVQARVVRNRLELFFEQMYLDSGGHGNILFKINSSGSLSVGDAVKSQADIYFDYNYPITTNEAETIFEILGLNETNIDMEVTIYPNPVKNHFNIQSDSKISKIELYDTAGRLLKVSFINKLETNQDISYFSTGTYFIKIYTEKGITAQKIIKQ